MAADDKSLRNIAAHAATRTHVARLEQATLGDVEAMRLLLRGGSVIDWHRLSFSDSAEVDRFLKLNEFDPADPRRHGSPRGAARRRRRVPDAQLQLSHPRRGGARHAGARSVPARVVARQEADVRLHRAQGHARHASPGRPRAALQAPGLRRRGLRLRRGQGGQVVEEIRAAGYPIVEFAWSRKERDSSSPSCSPRRRPIAADVFDKLRFRLITRSARRPAAGADGAAAPADPVQLRRPRARR